MVPTAPSSQLNYPKYPKMCGAKWHLVTKTRLLYLMSPPREQTSSLSGWKWQKCQRFCGLIWMYHSQLYHGNMPDGLSKADVFQRRVSLAAGKKASTKCWLQKNAPTTDSFVNIVKQLLVLEQWSPTSRLWTFWYWDRSSLVLGCTQRINSLHDPSSSGFFPFWKKQTRDVIVRQQH